MDITKTPRSGPTRAQTKSVPGPSPRQFAISTLTMMGSAVLLCILVTLMRDRGTKSLILESAEYHCRALREFWMEMNCLPAELPQSEGGEHWVALEKFAGDQTRWYASRTDQPVLVGYTQMAQLYASYNARAVILLQDGRLEAKLLREGEFQKMLAAQTRQIEALLEEARSAAVTLPK